MLKERTIIIKNQKIKVIDIIHQQMSVTLLPAQGFSLISFKIGQKELLSQWELEKFIGTEEDIVHVSKNLTDTFRKGFGIHIDHGSEAEMRNQQTGTMD